MTNREYLNQKKEAFYQKCNDVFEKNLKLMFVVEVLITILSLVAVFKISIDFMFFVIPSALLSLSFG